MQHDIADGCSFHRSCHDRHTDAVGCHLHQITVARTTSNDMQPLDGERCHVFQIAQHLTITHSEALKNAARHRLIIMRHRLPCLFAILLYGLNHADRIGEIWSIREDKALEWSHLHAILVDLVDISRSICPFFAATFQKPHATDILQETGGSFHSTLIGEVILIALLRDDSLLRLNAQERPRTATEIGKPFVLSRHGCHCSSCIMSSHCHHRHCTQTCHTLHFRCQHTHLVTWVHITSELTLLQSYHLNQFGSNPSCTGIQHLACRENGVFTHCLSRQHIHQCIRHKQYLIRNIQSRIMVLSQSRQLEK